MAFLASTSSNPHSAEWFSLYSSLIAWTEPSIPLFKPERNWSAPHRSVISSHVAMAMTLTSGNLSNSNGSSTRTLIQCKPKNWTSVPWCLTIPQYCQLNAWRVQLQHCAVSHCVIHKGSLANVTLWIHQDQHCPESARLPSQHGNLWYQHL